MRSIDRAVFFAICLCAIVSATSLTVAGSPQAAFTEEGPARGLLFNLTDYPQTQGYVGQGCGFVDLDNDRDPDIIIIGATSNQVGIYENIGGTFVSRSATSGIPLLPQHEGFAAGDYNGDGLLDLYITQSNNNVNYLFRNDGNFTFTNVTPTTGTNNGLNNSTGVTWGDYNNDGWIDLYVSNYSQVNALYRNNAGNNFSNLGAALGVNGGNALTFLNVWTDFDRDGDVDLYISNDRATLGWPGNKLWRNDNGVFTDISAGSGADISIFSMGIGVGDVDNNLYPDLYMTNIFAYDTSGEEIQYDGINPLLLNQADATFIDSTEIWETDNRITSWAAIVFDWDNDGFKDLYVVNQFEPNSFYVCEGGPPCAERAMELNVTGQFDPAYTPGDTPEIASYNAAVADVDGDGDLDLLTTNLGGRVQLYINNEGTDRNSLRMNIVGEHPNTYAVGASVEVDAAGTTQFQEVYAGGNGYLGQNELVIHFGIDADESATEARVQWPSGGSSRTLTGLPANTQWDIYPPGRLCDHDGDEVVDYDDFVEFSSCFSVGFSVGCEMMDHSGNSSIHVEDLQACFVDTPADCNANGTEDLAEILLDGGIDNDQDSVIDCCQSGSPDDPNPVGATLLVDRNGSGDALLSWSAPVVDGSHAAATSYDVFRRQTTADGPFELLNQVGGASTSDDDTITDIAYYLIGARNACGSSGEEPF